MALAAAPTTATISVPVTTMAVVVARCQPLVVAQRLVTFLDELACLRVDDLLPVTVTAAVDESVDHMPPSRLVEVAEFPHDALGDRPFDARAPVLEPQRRSRVNGRLQGDRMEARRRGAFGTGAPPPVCRVEPVW